MKSPSWRQWAPTGVAIAAVAALVFTLMPRATAAPTKDPMAQAPVAEAVACPQPPSALTAAVASDYFLKIDNIRGDSTDLKHPNEIVVGSYIWGLNLDFTACSKASQKPTFSDIRIVKQLDQASPKLAQAVATGQQIPNAVLTAVKDSPERPEYLTITLTNVVITSYSTSAASNSLPQDSFSVSFAQIKYEFRPQKPDGSLDTPVVFCWNVTADAAC
jgi:type VI secretion system secreted protein Hcp